jgi:putative restriction endonuclease
VILAPRSARGAAPPLAYWWVNHKQTRDHEVRGDYLWSPRRNQNGARNQSYDNMALAQPGDVVYSYANGVLGAVGIVIARASPCPKPTEFGSVGDYWSNDGWLLPVAFTELERAVRPRNAKALMCRPAHQLRRALPR